MFCRDCPEKAAFKAMQQKNSSQGGKNHKLKYKTNSALMAAYELHLPCMWGFKLWLLCKGIS